MASVIHASYTRNVFVLFVDVLEETQHYTPSLDWKKTQTARANYEVHLTATFSRDSEKKTTLWASYKFEQV